MARWIRVDDDPSKPLRLPNLVVNREKFPHIVQWYNSIPFGKASDEIRKAIEFYIAHGQGKIQPATPVAESPAAPMAPSPVSAPISAVQPVVDVGLSDGAAGVLDNLEKQF